MTKTKEPTGRLMEEEGAPSLEPPVPSRKTEADVNWERLVNDVTGCDRHEHSLTYGTIDANFLLKDY